jgi:CheY-like chemotaxis protein
MDAEEIRWIKATTNELNNLLQVISESGEVLESCCDETAETAKYFAILRSGIDRATKVAVAMADRVGGSGGEGLALPVLGSSGVDETVLPDVPPLPPKPTSGPLVPPLTGDVRVHNPSGNRELIMVVDDEDFVTMLAQRVLADEGYRVITARDGFQAVEMHRKLRDQISLIILDFTMPVMDGADVFAELLEINPNVPVVLSSGFAEQTRLQSMLARGLRGFIPKPYTHQKLLSQVRSTLDALGAQKSGERRIF